jgi:hypothetical protein
MKRYRVLSYDFDTRAVLLQQEIGVDWEEPVKNLWKANQARIKESVLAQYGIIDGVRKLKDFTEFGGLPISIIGYHNRFLRQIRDSYVQGAYYPALTAACTLGERILNHLVLGLRDDYIHTPEFARVGTKSSFDNWEIAIRALERWEVLVPNAASSFRKLKVLRNRVIHFSPEADSNDKALALEACQTLIAIVQAQFSGFERAPWYINAPGATYVKKASESLPFVKRIVLRSCALVGPFHTLRAGLDGWLVEDEHIYEDREITDEEFVSMIDPRPPV